MLFGATKSIDISNLEKKKEAMHVSVKFQGANCVCIWKINELPRDKINKVSVRPAKTQISLGIRPVWSEFSLCS